MPAISQLRIPARHRATLPEPKDARFPCNFCRTNDHNLCPRVYRNGSGSIHFCPCNTQHDPRVVRCTECYNTNEGEVDTKVWLCNDVEACGERIMRRVEKTEVYQQITQAQDSAREKQIAEGKRKPARPRGEGRPKTGQCLCCGETTGGGKFKPGHDARMVSQLATKVQEGADADKVKADFAALGVSDALQAKLAKRIGNL